MNVQYARGRKCSVDKKWSNESTDLKEKKEKKNNIEKVITG